MYMYVVHVPTYVCMYSHICARVSDIHVNALKQTCAETCWEFHAWRTPYTSTLCTCTPYTSTLCTCTPYTSTLCTCTPYTSTLCTCNEAHSHACSLTWRRRWTLTHTHVSFRSEPWSLTLCCVRIQTQGGICSGSTSRCRDSLLERPTG
jgi:hypothetical protein